MVLLFMNYLLDIYYYVGCWRCEEEGWEFIVVDEGVEINSCWNV